MWGATYPLTAVLQCCLKWKRLRARKGDRITHEVVETLAKNGLVNADSLDQTLVDFGLGVSIKDKMASRQVVPKDGSTSVSKEQLLAAIRQTKD
jgi:hypothetical protein